MYSPRFTTFFFISLCIHMAGAAATAFILNSYTRKHSEESVKVKLVDEKPNIFPAKLYTEIDLSRKERSEQPPQNAQIISWQSSKAHLPPGPSPSQKPGGQKSSLRQGTPLKSRKSNHPAEISLKGDTTDKENHQKRVPERGDLPPKKITHQNPSKLAETVGNTPFLRNESIENNVSSADDEPISLETTKAEYMEYFQKIQRKIDEAWEYPAEAMMHGDSGNSEVNFRILNDGTVKDALVFSSSGSESLDKESVKAVLGAAPYPPIPAELGRNRLNIVATFRYSMNFGAQQ